ncbi:hypothetical protein [Streptomyces sp. SID13726]|uniref:hypothetical protein n=1 Tax=Streptomyces sp. SID13726 TaxID=2706058 RepID=UPI00194383F6|nr:hypothetical protein [Streptomyces sp. SID13726]
MIIRIHPREFTPAEPLAKALGRAVSDQEGLTEYTVVAHWPGLDSCTPDGEHKAWTAAEWGAYLDAPSVQHPDAASPEDDILSVWHAAVCLHPSDRVLTGPEWSEIAHRIARVAGIQRPGEDRGCRWIAVQAQPGRLDLLANLIRPDGIWTAQHPRLPALLSAECRRIETALQLRSPQGGGPDREQVAGFLHRAAALADAAPPGAADATTQLAGLLRQLADERTGSLATVRGLVEHAAHRLDRLPHAYGPAAGHQLELIARRLYGIQQDLDTAARALPPGDVPAPSAGMTRAEAHMAALLGVAPPAPPSTRMATSLVTSPGAPAPTGPQR